MSTAKTNDAGLPKRGPKPKPTAAAVGVPAKPKQARFSREETRTRILDVAEELFSRRDPSKVTVREIAEAAGVTHPLVHQYVGSKSDILDAVIKRGAPRRHQMMSDNPDYRQVMPELFEDVLDRKVHTKSIVRSAMDGVTYAPFEDRLKTGRLLLELAKAAAASGGPRRALPEALDPRFVVAAATALAYGWTAAEDWLITIFDLQDEDPTTVRDHLQIILGQVTELVFPLGQESASDDF